MVQIRAADLHRAELERLETEGKVQRRGGLKIVVVRDRKPGLNWVRLWRGKQAQPFYNYLVPSGRTEAVIAEKVVNEADRRQGWRDEDRAKAAEMAKKLTVGTLLHYSWGYDQTNCEFYEVVAKPSPMMVTLRRIGSRQVPGSAGFMSERLTPARGHYVGEPFNKRVGPYGVSFDFGTATPTTDDAPEYSSWYA